MRFYFGTTDEACALTGNTIVGCSTQVNGRVRFARAASRLSRNGRVRPVSDQADPHAQIERPQSHGATLSVFFSSSGCSSHRRRERSEPHDRRQRPSAHGRNISHPERKNFSPGATLALPGATPSQTRNLLILAAPPQGWDAGPGRKWTPPTPTLDPPEGDSRRRALRTWSSAEELRQIQAGSGSSKKRQKAKFLLHTARMPDEPEPARVKP